MKRLSASIHRGCNVYHDDTLILQEVDLGEFTGLRSAEAGRNFVQRFIKRFGDLEKLPNEGGLQNAFLDRLRSAEGVPFIEVLFQAILAVDASMAFAMRRFDIIKHAEIVTGPSPERASLVWNCWVPGVSRRAAEVGLQGVLELLPKRMRGASTVDDDKSFNLLYDSLRSYARRHRLGCNASNLARTLDRKNIPWERSPLDGNVILAGQGQFQQYLGNAATEATSSVACRFARNKQLTNRLLKDLGLPVTRQARARNIEEALEAAENFGYPVVVKPIGGHMGEGVSADLKGPEEVPAAFECANQFEKKGVLVESFVEGQDHRLLVVNGRFIAATKRVPPFVTGDGRRTIRELIEKLNSDPRRDGITLSKITQNLELDRLLDRSRYTLDTVLRKGERFALRSMANMSTGGTTTDVTDRVHPDNQEMAIRAAEAVGLDVAGIDFITTDIGISWKQTGGAIIEVNNSPGLDLHTYPAEGESRNVADVIVESVFPGDNQGRVPIAVVVGGGQLNGPVARVLNDLLRSAGMTVGLVIGRDAFVNGVRTNTEDAVQRQAIRSVLRDRRVEALISTVWLHQVLNRGLIHDACEVAAFIGIPSDENIPDARQALDVVLRATRGKLVVGVETALALEIVGAVDPGRIVLVSRTAGGDAARHYLETHLASGGQAVVAIGNRGARVIVLRQGNQTVASIPVKAIPALAQHRSRRQLEAHLFAAALASGMGLSEEAITSALRDRTPLRDATSHSEVRRPALVASPMSHPSSTWAEKG